MSQLIGAISNRLKEAREEICKQKQWSQKYFAKWLGVDYNTYRGIEKGLNKRIDIDFLEKFSYKTGKPLRWIIFGEEISHHE